MLMWLIFVPFQVLLNHSNMFKLYHVCVKLASNLHGNLIIMKYNVLRTFIGLECVWGYQFLTSIDGEIFHHSDPTLGKRRSSIADSCIWIRLWWWKYCFKGVGLLQHYWIIKSSLFIGRLNTGGKLFVDAVVRLVVLRLRWRVGYVQVLTFVYSI